MPTIITATPKRSLWRIWIGACLCLFFLGTVHFSIVNTIDSTNHDDLIHRNKTPLIRGVSWTVPAADSNSDMQQTHRQQQKPLLGVPPMSQLNTQIQGNFGSNTFRLFRTDYESLWHDIPLHVDDNDMMIVNMVTEIPMHQTAKMELQKTLAKNPISHDTNSDGTVRHYTYGKTYFNYGYIPQTWEDPNLKSKSTGAVGDNDPLDVMEVGGSTVLEMGSVTPCRVLGYFELVDQGETDYKIFCIALVDQHANTVRSMNDLERIQPGHIAKLRDWLVNYKTTDGKPPNTLAMWQPAGAREAVEVIEETHQRWKALCGQDGTNAVSLLSQKAESFWLQSPGCRGSY